MCTYAISETNHQAATERGRQHLEASRKLPELLDQEPGDGPVRAFLYLLVTVAKVIRPPRP